MGASFHRTKFHEYASNKAVGTAQVQALYCWKRSRGHQVGTSHMLAPVYFMSRAPWNFTEILLFCRIIS